MRRCYLVCYDIRNDKRLRHVHRFLKAYGERWQYSVFYCTLRAIDRVRLETGLRDIINMREDQVLIVDLGANEEAVRESATFVGVEMPKSESGIVVI